MNDPNMFAYAGEAGAPLAPPPPAGPPSGYRFSAEEMRVLSECNNESFYQRSLPIGTVLGVGAWAGVQQGWLRPSLRFGAVPKVTLAVVVGYFAGKLSYQNACAEKLMALPGSYIGQLLRDKKEGRPPSKPVASPSGSMFPGAAPGDVYSDAGPGSSLNLDTDRPLFSEDAYRAPQDHDGSNRSHPTTDAGGAGAGSGAGGGAGMSYEELRRRNRGLAHEQRADPYKMDGPIPPVVRPPAPRAAPTNKYGDVVD